MRWDEVVGLMQVMSIERAWLKQTMKDTRQVNWSHNILLLLVFTGGVHHLLPARSRARD